MTDKEMAEEAEEYANKNVPVDTFGYRSLDDVHYDVKQAFLAGLKAGRETEREYVKNNAFTSMKEQGLFPFGKWNRISDDDLPKENKLYLVKIKDNGLAIAYFNSLHWETRYNLGKSGHCVETVIAWCEIPKFVEIR